jgi:hypothetical protein
VLKEATQNKAPEYSVSYSLLMVKWDPNASDEHSEEFYVIYCYILGFLGDMTYAPYCISIVT